MFCDRSLEVASELDSTVKARCQLTLTLAKRGINGQFVSVDELSTSYIYRPPAMSGMKADKMWMVHFFLSTISIPCLLLEMWKSQLWREVDISIIALYSLLTLSF